MTTLPSRLSIFGTLLLVAACGDDTAPPHDVAGETLRPANLVIDPTAVDFGDVVLGTASAPTVITVLNDGDYQSTAPVVTMSGPDRDAFLMQSLTCAESLAPARSCRVVIAFSPRKAGAANATVEVVAQAGGTVAATLTGLGIIPPTLVITVDTDDLGGALVGTTSPLGAQARVENVGDRDTGPLRVAAPPSDFDLADHCSGLTLAPGASCLLDVTFTPKSTGEKTLFLRVDAQPGGSATIPIHGEGLSLARLALAPTSLAFEDVPVGTTVSADVVVRNSGGNATGPLEITLAGLDPDAFSLSGCADGPLDPGASCTVTVAYAPTSPDVVSAVLSVRANPGGQVFTSLDANAIASSLTITPDSMAFPATPIDATSIPLELAVKNVGPQPSGPLELSTRGPAAAAFTVVAMTDRCSGVSLDPNERCTFEVVFSSPTRGDHQAELVATSPVSGTGLSTLAAIALAPAALTATPTSLDFGAQVVGTSPPVHDVLIENLGDEPSGPLTLTLSGPDAALFEIVTHTCVIRLTPAQECRVSLRYAPRAVAPATATLTIGATPGGPLVVPLAGAGAAPDQLRVEPASHTFPDRFLGDTTTFTFAVVNTSDASTGPILFSESGSPDLSFAHDCSTLPARASCSVTATFTPRTTGPHTRSFTINARPGGTITTEVFGVGLRRVLLTAPDGAPLPDDTLDFGALIAGTSQPRELDVTLTNQTALDAPFLVLGDFPAPAQFALVSHDCGPTLAPEERCTVRLRFSPVSIGEHRGTVRFSLGGSAHAGDALAVVGRGTPSLSILPDTVADFGPVPRNTTSAPLGFRVANAGDAPTSGPLFVSVSGAGFTLASNGCNGVSLGAGQTCPLSVTWTPAANGPASATLTAAATPGGQATLTVDALGVDPTGRPPTAITLTPSSVAESAPIGTTVGTLATIDPDSGETHRYTLVYGDVAFSLSGNTLVTKVLLDHEATPTRTIIVRVIDSGGHLFEQNLTVTITDVDEPTTLTDDAFTVEEDAAPTTLDVTANDVDPEAEVLVSSVTQPPQGTVTIAADKRTVTYTPKPDVCNTPPGTSPDQFRYAIADGSSARVTVSILCVDDPSTAVDDVAFISEGAPTTAIPVLTNDLDVDGNLRIIAVTQPAEGTVAIINNGTELTYTPDPLPTETTEIFTYTLLGGSIGTVTVNVALTTTGCDRLDPALCVNGTCVDGGTLDATCVCDDGWDGDACDVETCAATSDCGSLDDVCLDEICVEDACVSTNECPPSHTCQPLGPAPAPWECAYQCTSDAECRDGEACKWAEAGRTCGETGDGESGASCADYTGCGAQRDCVDWPGGYCAHQGCTSNEDCEPDTRCVTVDERSVCALLCDPESCREDEGYACLTLPDPDAIDQSVCVPAN